MCTAPEAWIYSLEPGSWVASLSPSSSEVFDHIVPGVTYAAILVLGRNDIDLNVHRKSTGPPEPNSLEVHNRFDFLSCTRIGTEQVLVISDVNFGNCILWEGLLAKMLR